MAGYRAVRVHSSVSGDGVDQFFATYIYDAGVDHSGSPNMASIRCATYESALAVATAMNGGS